MVQRAPQTASSFDTRVDVPSMGDPEFVDGRVRVMLDEARKLLFEADNPRAGVEALVDKWAKEFRADNPDYIQTMSQLAQDVFLRTIGCDSEGSTPGDPVKALVTATCSRAVDAFIAFHEDRIDEEQLGFAIDTAVEDCQQALLGLHNPAD